MESDIKKKFDSYPNDVCELILNIRRLILDTAKEDQIPDIEETLKWGEPSFLAKGGSPVRVDWKPKHPHQYAIYFNCKTTLIETFKEVYGDLFQYEGNRAILFQLSDHVPEAALKHCISMALRYHRIKHLPLLGA
ncbi:MAG: DUF1801 domain-containing protein [Chromatiales bacterium]|nr:DUF1801 domain-containing protein [Chromatiales bacterium]